MFSLNGTLKKKTGRSGDVKRNNLLGWLKIFLKGFAIFVISKDVAIVRGLGVGS